MSRPPRDVEYLSVVERVTGWENEKRYAYRTKWRSRALTAGVFGVPLVQWFVATTSGRTLDRFVFSWIETEYIHRVTKVKKEQKSSSSAVRFFQVENGMKRLRTAYSRPNEDEGWGRDKRKSLVRRWLHTYTYNILYRRSEESARLAGGGEAAEGRAIPSLFRAACSLLAGAEPRGPPNQFQLESGIFAGQSGHRETISSLSYYRRARRAGTLVRMAGERLPGLVVVGRKSSTEALTGSRARPIRHRRGLTVLRNGVVRARPRPLTAQLWGPQNRRTVSS